MDSVKPFPRILPSLGWIILYFVLQALCMIAVLGVMALSDHSIFGQLKDNRAALETSPVLGLTAMWGILLSVALTLLLLWFNMRKENRMERIGLMAPSALPMAQTIGYGVGLMVLVYALTWVYSTYIIPGVDMQGATRKMLEAIPKTPFNFVLKLLAVAVAAPIVEELLFRGYLQNALKSKMSAPLAIALSGLVFALIHFQPYAIPALFALGASFGYLYHRAGSLKTNIALHVINNGLALAFG